MMQDNRSQAMLQPVLPMQIGHPRTAKRCGLLRR
jgi:hypothetical protein